AASGTSSYVTRTKFSMVTVPPDAKLYQVLKRQAFEQKDTNAPGLLTSGNPYIFEATVFSSSSNSVSNATIRLPAGTIKTLPSLADGSGFSLTDSFSAKSAFDTAYPSGTY